MTISYNEVASRVQNTLNALSKDTFIPKRYILHVFKTKAEFLMAQKFYDKSLFRETNLFKWIDCVQMDEVSPNKCGVELQACSRVMKSRKKLPKLIWSRYGASAVSVVNIDGSKEYEIISHSYYNTIRKKRGFDKFKGNYAIIYPDNHLYIPDSSVKKVNILVYSLDEKIQDVSDCEDTCTCESYWNTEVEISDKLIEPIFQETLREISMRMNIPYDANENNDPNVRSKSE